MANITNSGPQRLDINWQVQEDPAIIVDLVKSNAILQTGLAAPASHGNKHKYKKWNSLPAGTFRALGGSIVPINISKDMEQIDIWECSALMEIDEKELRDFPGGINAAIAAYLPGVIEGMGQTLETQIVYGTTTFGSQDGFLGLHQYTKAYGNVVAQLAGASASRTSIFAVRWDAQSGASLRVSPNPQGDLITIEDKGSYMAVSDTTTGAKQPVHGWVVTANFSLVIPAKKAAAVITQIDATHYPTALNLESLINAVRGPGQIRIYANLSGLAAIDSLKYAKAYIDVSNTGFNSIVSTWNNIPVVLDENIVSTETTALD